MREIAPRHHCNNWTVFLRSQDDLSRRGDARRYRSRTTSGRVPEEYREIPQRDENRPIELFSCDAVVAKRRASHVYLTSPALGRDIKDDDFEVDDAAARGTAASIMI
jgi:hypothetical protein